jgi:hypothetical protein
MAQAYQCRSKAWRIRRDGPDRLCAVGGRDLSGAGTEIGVVVIVVVRVSSG